MRALVPSLLIALLGCAEGSPQVAVTRQSVLIFPDAGPRVRGNVLGARMGAALTTCPAGGWVAAAPGEDSVYVSSLRGRLEPGRLSLTAVEPLPIACLGANATLRVLMGGPSDAWSVLPDGGSAQLFTSRVDSFDVSGGYLAVGSTSPGVINVFRVPTTNAALTNPTFTSAPAWPGVGNAISWGRRGDLLVGNFTARAAGVYFADANNPDAGRLLASAFPLPNPDAIASNTDYGRVVLIADVTADVGEEYLVASPALGRVYVFSGTALVETLAGGASFGASLALEPASFGGLHAVWVGEPNADLVHRYFGGLISSFPAPPEGEGASFGAAIAVDQRGVVAIGAPDWDDGLLLGAGTVFEATFDGGPTSGQLAQCIPNRDCQLRGCTTGLCVSGVFCQQIAPLGSDCAPGEQCDTSSSLCVPAPDASVSVDAGAPDAGAPDAGPADAGSDAGTSDAGGPDGGEADAGTDAGVGRADGGTGEVELFHTCGCTTADLPLLLLGLAFFRRRVTAK